MNWSRPLASGAILLAGILSSPWAPAAAEEPGAYPFLLAQTLAGDGELESALAAYADAAALAPTDPFVRLAYAELLAQTGQTTSALEQIAEAERIAPDEPAVSHLQARIAMARADRDPASRAVARSAFERWLLTEPDDLEALVALGQLYLGEGEADRAVEVLNRAAALRPGQPMIEGLRARALVQAGDLGAAEEVQKALLREHPERLDVRFELAESLSSRGRAAEADALLAEAPAEQQKSPELRRRRAIARTMNGDLAGARALAVPLQAELPDNATLKVLLATIEQADGNWERVAELLGSVVERPQAPESVVAMQVEALERLERIDDALKLLDARAAGQLAEGKSADATSTAIQAADLALTSGRVDEASRRAVALGATPAANAEEDRRRSVNVAWILADCALARKDWRGAQQALAGLDLMPAKARLYEIAMRAGDPAAAEALRAPLAAGDPDDQVALAETEARLERFTEAESLYRKALARQPDALRARFGLATVLERAGRRSESESEFEHLLEQHPDHAPSLNYLGYMWIESSRNLDRAVAMVTRAVLADPANAAYVDSLGWGLHQLGRADEAVRFLERASRLEPGDATILEHLGDACVQAGDLARARSAYERALSVAGEGHGLSEKIARLARPGGAS